MPTDTTVNALVINKLTKAQYDEIQNPSPTELYLVPDEIDNVPTSGSDNPVKSGGIYTKLEEKQDTIDSSHKLSADLVDDSSSTNKFTNATEKGTWNGKQAKITATGILKGDGNGGVSAALKQDIVDLGIPGTDTNTTYKLKIGNTTNGDSVNGVDLGTLENKAAASGGTDLSLVTTGEKYAWNNKQKAIAEGRGITITPGANADTVSFNLPIYAGSGTNSIIEGGSSTASGDYSHVEGDSTIARGQFSHAEGNNTEANGGYSHAEGLGTEANGYYSHAEGRSTTASNAAEHASGRYNESNKASTTFGDSGNTLFSVGNGTADNKRHNAFEIRQNGDIYITIGGQDVKLQDNLGNKVDKTTTVNGHALSGNVTVTKSDVELGNVGNYKAVSTVASQGLTETEKSDARANIGAGTSNFSGSYNDLTDKPTSLPANGGNSATVNNHTVLSDVPANAVFTDTNTWRPLGTGATDACAGNDIRLSNERVAANIDVVVPIFDGDTQVDLSYVALVLSDYNRGSVTFIYNNETSTDCIITVPTTYTGYIIRTPDGNPIELTCPAGGYCEVSVLKNNLYLYIRGI